MSVVVNNNLIELLGVCAIGGNLPPKPWVVHLYVNYRVPTPSDGTGLYTECTWPGYSQFTLVPTEWMQQPPEPSVSYFTYPLITFTFDPSNQAQQTVFGYYVTGTDGVMYLAELFPAPFPIPPEGGSLPLLLTWQSEQCPQSF